MSLKLVCISDTHEKQEQLVLPEGDVLIHAGDLTNQGTIPALTKVAAWFEKQNFKHKVVICGNHDFCFQNRNHDTAVKLFADAGVTYLQDSEVIIDGVKFYGSPWQPWFMDWAFNLKRGKLLAEKWAKIPDDTNVLITHGPPFMIHDLAPSSFYKPEENTGCQDLLNRISQLNDLKVHVFGHIHNGYGTTKHGPCTFVNAATCTERYEPTNPPIIIEL